MPSAFTRFATDDAAKFVDPTLMGTAATRTPAGATTSSTVNLLFQEPTVADPGDPGVQDTHPTALADAADITDSAPGDRYVIDSVSYFVTESRPDGHGHIVLTLTLAPAVPLAPTTLAHTWVGGHSIPLSWSLGLADSGGPARTALELWYKLDTDEDWILASTLAAAAIITTWTEPDFGIWKLRVRGINAAGAGYWSNTLTVDTEP